jgi:hypothetical protein
MNDGVMKLGIAPGSGHFLICFPKQCLGVSRALSKCLERVAYLGFCSGVSEIKTRIIPHRMESHINYILRENNGSFVNKYSFSKLGQEKYFLSYIFC